MGRGTGAVTEGTAESLQRALEVLSKDMTCFYRPSKDPEAMVLGML